MTEEAQPARRRPGRPRKTPILEPAVKPAESQSESRFPPDERVGMKVADSRWTRIGYPDDREYLIEDGVIVERVR